MIKIKLSEMGGYVYGDGGLPAGFNPDEFIKLFMHRIIEAKAQGMEELGLSEEEINLAIFEAKQEADLNFDKAYVQEVEDDFIADNGAKLLELV